MSRQIRLYFTQEDLIFHLERGSQFLIESSLSLRHLMNRQIHVDQEDLKISNLESNLQVMLDEHLIYL